MLVTEDVAQKGYGSRPLSPRAVVKSLFFLNNWNNSNIAALCNNRAATRLLLVPCRQFFCEAEHDSFIIAYAIA